MYNPGEHSSRSVKTKLPSMAPAQICGVKAEERIAARKSLNPFMLVRSQMQEVRMHGTRIDGAHAGTAKQIL
jgi:hypothetical protein